MKSQDFQRVKYKSDLTLKQIRRNVISILGYIFMVWLWQFALSYQSSFYTLMNWAVFLMLACGAILCVVSKEDREAVVKGAKNQVIVYLFVTFVYDIFLRSVNIPISGSDPGLTVARNFLTVISAIIKITYPVAYIIWCIQKLAIFKKSITKERQMAILRDVRRFTRKNKKEKEVREKDNFNNRY